MGRSILKESKDKGRLLLAVSKFGNGEKNI